MLIYKIFLNITLESIILQVFSVAGCVHSDKSKCFIALPIDAKHVRVFEKTLIGGFSCVNTRLALDTEIFLHSNKNETVTFDIYSDGKKQTERISTKLVKIDENNQYGHAMTKPLPYCYIKKQEYPPSLAEFNRILDKIYNDDNITHLFIVDIKFHHVIPKALLFNKTYLP